MGILRADRITGLGGANAIKGSVFFPQNSYIDVSPDSGLDLSGDFTVEMWVYNLPSPQITSHARQISSKNYYQAGSDGNWYFGLNRNSNTNFDITFYSYDGTGSAEYVNGSVGSDLEKWYHIAASRSGSTLKLFVDGVEKASGTLSKGLDDGGNNGLLIGGMAQSGGEASTWGDHYGYISNLRIIKGTALYTAAFTAPAFELNQTSDTTLLCCQSPGNILQEKTGKILTILTHNSAGTGGSDEGAVATRFTPNSPVGFSTTTDVGSQHGSTFDGFGSFATSTYMVPPGGNTRERNRGRGIFAGGVASPYEDIQVMDISSGGIAQDFGDLKTATSLPGSASSTTRMLINGSSDPAPTNTIEFITIASIASSTDYGDLTVARRRIQSLSNSTRAVHVAGSGTSPTPYHNTIDYNTIATLGDSTDFGDTDAATLSHGGSVASSTRGVYSVGYEAPAYSNIIEYITIATTGDGQDFGDLSAAKGYHFRGSICDTTRGLFAGGYNPVQETIDFVTMATTGNAKDFGDLTQARRSGGGTANSIHSIFAGGYLPGVVNTIDRVLIQTTGNAADFGDLFLKTHEISGSSDSHGGL